MLTGKFWEEWEKPWSEEQTKLAYIQAPVKFTIEDLAKNAGRSKKTLYNWQDAKGEDWNQLRDEYFKSLHTEAQARSIEKSAEYVGDNLRKVLEEHFTTAKRYRTVASVHSLAISTEVLKLCAEYETGEITITEFAKRMKNYKGIEMLNWVNTLGRAIELERQALSMDFFQNLDKAHQFLEQAGYVVIKKDEFDELISEDSEESESEKDLEE